MSDFIVKYEYSDRGCKGQKGDKGDKGGRGCFGPAGPEGPSGPKGAKGEIGIKGIKGNQGFEGNIGPRGKGYRGNDGPKGIKGEKGVHILREDIINGTTVLFYSDGNVAEFTPNSIKGAQGDYGNIGIKGDIGDTGPIGSLGIKGLQGDSGNDGNIGSSVIDLDSEVNNNIYKITEERDTSVSDYSVTICGEKGEKGSIGQAGTVINVNYKDYTYGFCIDGNSALLYTASQVEDEEYYLQSFETTNIEDDDNNIKTKYFFKPKKQSRYRSSCCQFKQYFDEKISGIYNSTNNQGNILAGSLNSISPYGIQYLNSIPYSQYSSRGLTIKATGINADYLNIEGITVNIGSILDNFNNGFRFINNKYEVTNNNIPNDSKKFYGISKIANFNFYTPIKIVIRLEEHSHIGNIAQTDYRYTDNTGQIFLGTTTIPQNCASSTLLKYSEWFSVESSDYIDLTNLIWHTVSSNSSDIKKLCIRYKFSLPTEVTVGNILANFNQINKNNLFPNVQNGNSINKVVNINTNRNNINAVAKLNQYNSLSNNDKVVYLPQIISTIIPIRELCCIIKTSI